MTAPRMVRVTWHDSMIVYDGWTDGDEIVRQGAEMYDVPITTCGFLVAEKPEYIIVALGHNPNAEQWAAAMEIPTSEIIEMVDLRRK